MTPDSERNAERPSISHETVSHTHTGGDGYKDYSTDPSGAQVTQQETEHLFGGSVRVLPDALPDGFCTHSTGTLYSIEHKKLFPAPCNRWRVCGPCRRWLATRFALQIQYEALNAGRWFGWFWVARTNWKAKQRWLRRHKMRYRAFPIGTGDVLKVVTHHPEPAENHLEVDGSDVLLYKDKLALWVYRQLLQTPDDRRPSASDGFGGPRYEGTRPNGMGQYRFAPKTPEQARRDLLDAALRKASTRGGWIDKKAMAQLQQLADSGVFMWPSDLTDAEAVLAITTPTEPPIGELLPQRASGE